MIAKPDLDDAIGIIAFACLGLLIMLMLVIGVMVLMNVTPAVWFNTVAFALTIILPAIFAGCVVASEVVR